MNVGSLLARHARFRPDKVAVVCGARRLTFAEHYAAVNRLSNALRGLGLAKGDKIAIILPNCIELLESYRACAQLGLVSVPLSPLLRGSGLVTLLRDSDTAAVIAGATMIDALSEARTLLPSIDSASYIVVGAPRTHGYRDYAELTRGASSEPPPPVEIGDDDVCNIIYSSGTTGDPKGIVHTHYVRALYCTMFASQFRFTPESVVLHAGSLVFNGAFVTLMPAWYLGCTYILQEKFDAAGFIDTVERERVTHVMMVPSQNVGVIHAPNLSGGTLSSLRMLCSVGAPWHREHKEKLLPLLPDSLYELYGLTEGFITVLDSKDFARKIDSVGTPIAFSDMRIVSDDGRNLGPGEVGEIVGRSPLMMPGYYKRPDLTAQAITDGWLFSGDVGMTDAEGFLRLVDRKKDMIISGGVNVFPKDIEEVAVQHEVVREVAVFGIPHEKWGESPIAAVVLKSGQSVTGDELRAWINARVTARYQQVCDVVLVADLPRSAAGKTLKRVLREQYASRAAESVT